MFHFPRLELFSGRLWGRRGDRKIIQWCFASNKNISTSSSLSKSSWQSYPVPMLMGGSRYSVEVVEVCTSLSRYYRHKNNNNKKASCQQVIQELSLAGIHQLAGYELVGLHTDTYAFTTNSLVSSHNRDKKIHGYLGMCESKS